MALIRNTAAMRLKGRVGNTTYYTEGGRQIARVSQNSSNYGDTARRTEQQQQQRAKWANLVNFYKLSKGWMQQAFENKKATQSDYNRFMQLNVANASIYLTKDMYAAGGCVVEPFVISEGSLRSINVSKKLNAWKTDLKLGTLEITDATTVGAFSSALIAANSHLHNGVQISMVSYQQEINTFGIPQLICTAYEVTLDDSSDANLRNFLPEFCCHSVDGCLGTGTTISTGCFAYVLSDSTSGKTLVSSQRLVGNNTILIMQYSNRDAIAASIASYGVDADVFLMSGSKMQDAAAGTQYVAMVADYGQEHLWPVGEVGPNVGDLSYAAGGRFFLYMASPVAVAASALSVQVSTRRMNGDLEVVTTASVVDVDGNMLLINLGTEWYDNTLVGISVQDGSGSYVGEWRYTGVIEHE